MDLFSRARKMARRPASGISLMICLLAQNSFADRAAELVQQMSLEEKVAMVGGTGFATQEILRLGIPALEMIDGPIGIRFGEGTQWPSGTGLAATFNPELIFQFGQALGEEARANDKRLLLGPTINMARTTWGGRTFESYGEDPVLTSVLAKNYIQGVQSQGVGVSVKHFAANNQEWQRMNANVTMDERALRELYLPAFKSSVEAGAISVMAAYNKVNGHFASENSHLISDILKKEWGFTGFLISDWGATHSTVGAALAGLDLEMPVGIYFGDELRRSVLSKQVPESLLDDKVTRILRGIEKIGLFEPLQKPASAFQPRHADLALKIASESIVLLKNKNQLLPLSQKSAKIAVLGSSFSTIRQGGGSSLVHRGQPISPLAALRSRSPAQFVEGSEILLPGDPLQKSDLFYVPGTGEKGFAGEYYNNPDLSFPAAMIRNDEEINFDWEWGGPQGPEIPAEYFSVRWLADMKSAAGGDFEMKFVYNDGLRVFIDDELVLDQWTTNPLFPPLQEKKLNVKLQPNRKYKIQIEYLKTSGMSYVQLGVAPPQDHLPSDVELAKQADYALIYVGHSTKIESESYDRSSLKLTIAEEDLIKKVSAVQKNTIVIIQAGSAVDTSAWINHVAGVLWAWFPGEQGGVALADILFGNVNPSGRLPISFPAKWDESPAAVGYPGQNGEIHYADGILMGYRGHDASGKAAAFPFGYGLSYTKFLSRIMKVEKIDSSMLNPRFKIDLSVRNAGPVDGATMIPLYVSDLSPKVLKAPKELKAFQKVFLKAGQTKTISLNLNAEAFHYYDVKNAKWKIDSGPYRIGVYSNEAKLEDSAIIELQ